MKGLLGSPRLVLCVIVALLVTVAVLAFIIDRQSEPSPAAQTKVPTATEQADQLEATALAYREKVVRRLSL